MAVGNRSSSNLMFSLKAVLVSSVVVSMAVVLKVFVPVMLDFAVSGVPEMWISIRFWLKPPYLYVVINGIIITIVASSRFYRKFDGDEIHSSQIKVMESIGRSSEFVYEAKAVEILPELDYEVKMMPEVISPDFTLSDQSAMVISPDFTLSDQSAMVISPDFTLSDQSAMVIYEQSEVPEVKKKTVVNDMEAEAEEDKFVISRSDWTPPNRSDSSETMPEIFLPAQKPLVSARFSNRKPLKANPEGGKALRVSKPKRNETFESTWKAITDGRHVPLTRHLKKSDTMENQGHQINVGLQDRNVIKSETFKDRTNNPIPPVESSPPGSGKLKKEPSLSQDDLNRRVEAFIKKFNDDMRLQREESLNQYKEMINRGAAH